jgi:2-polyprenyl-3-methyl-5-hydroxy-6-metoxy-1,4-benzoquinol methylase
VLDVGCGSGRYEEAFMREGVSRIVAVDVSDKMIDLARANTARPGASNQPEFVCCDFAEFRPRESFDLVVAMGFFDYVDNPLAILSHMRVSVGHSVIASFPSISWYRTPIRRTRYFFKRCPVFFYTPGQIQALGRSVGFFQTDIVKIRGAGQDYFATFSV